MGGKRTCEEATLELPAPTPSSRPSHAHMGCVFVVRLCVCVLGLLSPRGPRVPRGRRPRLLEAVQKYSAGALTVLDESTKE